MKVIIACLNSKYIHASLAPWCLLSGVREFCASSVNAKVMEATINSDINTFAEQIINENPDVISFSSYIWNIEKTLELCKILKEKIGCTIILGGPEVSYRAKNVLENFPFVDFVLSGEGEKSFPFFIDTYINKGNFNKVSGLSYRAQESIITIPEEECTETPPSPYKDEFFDNLKGRISYIETSRGCPYRCAFCLSGRCSPLRFFDIEQVKTDILKLAVSGTKTIKFVDRTFNAKADRANEILEFILSNYRDKIPEGTCFHFEIAGDILKESTLDILSKAPKGVFQLEIGMQSFNEATLKAINRKTDTKNLIGNIKKLISFGNMHIHIDLIAGLTGEDIKSFERSFDIGYSLKANMLQMGFLKLLHGAEMRENKEKYPCEFNANPPYEVTSTPWLSNEEIVKLKKCEDALERMYNSGRFLFTLDYLLEECGYTPFKLFMDFGNEINGNKMSLSDYAIHIYYYFKEFADPERLRETLICDLLSSSSALQIPEIFKIKNDPLYKKAKKHFTEDKNALNKVAILYKSQRIFVVNQWSEKDFNGRYQSDFYDLKDFID